MENSTYKKRDKRKGKSGCSSVVCIILLLCIVISAYLVFFRDKLPAPNHGDQSPGNSTIINTSPSPNTSTNTNSDKIPNALPLLENYEYLLKTEADVHIGNLVLVNNKVNYVFPKGEEAGLVSIFDEKISSYMVRDTDVLLKEVCMNQLNEMMKEFNKNTKKTDVIVTSGHRTYKYQKNLLDKRIDAVGAAEASNWVAVPGGSEHHSGLAIDLGIFNKDGTSAGFTGTGKYEWINENCFKYGFIVRYNEDKSDITGISYEPWHFRYLGEPHAYLVTENGLCYEEYTDYLKDYVYGKNHLDAENFNGDKYEIYFVPSTGDSTVVPVPTDREHEISGNNFDGFIVTIKK